MACTTITWCVFGSRWWNGMHDDNIDYFINVRPQYLHDGSKTPDV